MTPTQTLKYFLKKAPELTSMSRKDFELSKLVMRVHRKKVTCEQVFVPANEIEMIHCIDRESALKQVNIRANKLRLVKKEWLAAKQITNKMMIKTIPSVSGIKVIHIDGRYISFEGNGRLMAIQQAFSQDAIELMVEVYSFEHDATISRRISRVQSLNGLNYD